MAAASSIALGGLALGGLGGAIAGAKGTPGQTVTNSLPGAGGTERRLQQLSMDQYLQSLQGLQQDQAYISQLDPIRQQALGIYQQGLQGNLSASPEQLAQIDAVRQAQIQAGTGDIQRLLGEALGQTASSAGVRGLRGQALSQLQGDNMNQAAQQIGSVVNQAGLQAAQQAYAAPQQQLQLAQQGMSYADQLRQQAFQNRQMAQNPALLDLLSRERFAQSTQSTPGQSGGFMGGLGGFLSGAGAGFGAAGQGLGGFASAKNAGLF